MAQTATFGIQTTADTKAMESLIEKVKTLLDLSAKVPQHFEAAFKSASAAADQVVKNSQKVTVAKQSETTRVKELITDRANAEEAAAKRRIETEERAAALTKSVESMTTEALVDDIFKLQQKREAAIRARNAAAAEGAKGEVAEQKKVIASLDEELGTLKKVSIQRKEVQKEGAGVKIGQLGTGREANEGSHKGGINPAELLSIAGAAEGLGTLVEKSKEVAEASKAMGTAFGDGAGKMEEEAERIGASMGKTKDETGTLMAKIHAATGAQGEQLAQYTQALIAAQDAGLQISAKSLQTQAGMQKLMAEGMPLVANAMKTAQEPAQQAILAQKDMEESAGELANTLLTDLAPAISLIPPILHAIGPYLPVIIAGIGAVAIAMNLQAIAARGQAIWNGVLTATTTAQTAATWLLNAAMAVNPFVWIVIGIVALIAAVVLLVTHWKEVVAWFEKAAATVMNAGGALLSLLGITGKAEAATLKHTKAVKDNSQAIADQKKALQDATQASTDYTDALKKNNDEQDKSAKESQDNAIAALQDIDAKLADSSKRLTGDTTESLTKAREQWVQYGKTAVAAQEAGEAAHHKAALEIGAASDKTPKEKKPKKGTTPEDIAKAAADKLLSIEKDKDARLTETDLEHKSAELKLEVDHAAEMLRIAELYHTKDSKEYADADLAALTAQHSFDNLSLDATAEKNKEHLAAQKQAVEDAEKLQAEAAARELKIQQDSDELRESMRVDSIQDEFEKARATEEDRFGKELADRESDIYNADGTLNALGESLWANHQGKMNAIAQQGADARKEIQKKEAEYFLGPIAEAYQKAFSIIDSQIDHSLGLDKKKGSAVQELASQVASSYIKMATQAVISGNISQVADEAAAGAKFVLAGASAIAKAFESLPFPLDIAAALASAGVVVGLVAELSHVHAHAQGTDNAPGGLSLVGERGPELMNVPRGAQIIPNHNLPNLGQPAQDNTPLLRAMQENNSLMRQQNALTAQTIPKRGAGAANSFHTLTRSQQQAQIVYTGAQIK